MAWSTAAPDQRQNARIGPVMELEELASLDRRAADPAGQSVLGHAVADPEHDALQASRTGPCVAFVAPAGASLAWVANAR